MRVLVVDDDPAWAMIVRTAIGPEGVTHAPTAHVGAVMLEAEWFDLVLVDVRMPGSAQQVYEQAARAGSVVRLVSDGAGVCGWSSERVVDKSIETIDDAIQEVARCAS